MWDPPLFFAGVASLVALCGFEMFRHYAQNRKPKLAETAKLYWLG